MVKGWTAKSDDWTRMNSNSTTALDIQQCHYSCHSVPGCRWFSFEDETKICTSGSGMVSAAHAIRSPTLKSVIGVKSGRLEKWCSMKRPLIFIFNGKIVYTNLNLMTIENNSCDEVKPGEADGSVDIFLHNEWDWVTTNGTTTGKVEIVPCACDSSCPNEGPTRFHMKSMKSSNKPFFMPFNLSIINLTLNASSTDFCPILRVYVLGDFCGRPKWWFRTPKAIPAPYAACDKCCKTENPDKMNVIFYTEEDNFAELCRIDMVKWLSDDNRE